MIKLSKEGIRKLQGSYETMRILDAIDCLDEVRGIMAVQPLHELFAWEEELIAEDE